MQRRLVLVLAKQQRLKVLIHSSALIHGCCGIAAPAAACLGCGCLLLLLLLLLCCLAVLRGGLGENDSLWRSATVLTSVQPGLPLPHPSQQHRPLLSRQRR